MQTCLTANPNLTIHTRGDFYGLPIQKDHGALIHNYLYSMQIVLEKAFNEHLRTCAFRVDLRLPTCAENVDTEVISRFIASLKAQIKANLENRRKMNERVHPCHLRYIWVKERNQALHDHYHLLLLVNKDCYHLLGDFNAISGNMVARIKKAWASALGRTLENTAGLVHFPKNPIYYLHRQHSSFHPEYDNLFYRISYFAKASTKNFDGNGRSFGCSLK